MSSKHLFSKYIEIQNLHLYISWNVIPKNKFGKIVTNTHVIPEIDGRQTNYEQELHDQKIEI